MEVLKLPLTIEIRKRKKEKYQDEEQEVVNGWQKGQRSEASAHDGICMYVNLYACKRVNHTVSKRYKLEQSAKTIGLVGWVNDSNLGTLTKRSLYWCGINVGTSCSWHSTLNNYARHIA